MTRLLLATLAVAVLGGCAKFIVETDNQGGVTIEATAPTYFYLGGGEELVENVKDAAKKVCSNVEVRKNNGVGAAERRYIAAINSTNLTKEEKEYFTESVLSRAIKGAETLSIIEGWLPKHVVKVKFNCKG